MTTNLMARSFKNVSYDHRRMERMHLTACAAQEGGARGGRAAAAARARTGPHGGARPRHPQRAAAKNGGSEPHRNAVVGNQHHAHGAVAAQRAHVRRHAGKARRRAVSRSRRRRRRAGRLRRGHREGARPRAGKKRLAALGQRPTSSVHTNAHTRLLGETGTIPQAGRQRTQKTHSRRPASSSYCWRALVPPCMFHVVRRAISASIRLVFPSWFFLGFSHNFAQNVVRTADT